ncbi:MAG TPA: hypothetical protein VLA72_12205 [Anaerolineales bacterium]|nr:hypothetical protein [Anaerolineales bacterium]
MNQEINCKNIIFIFISPHTSLFRAHPKGGVFRNRRTNYFPSLLGEIKLDHQGKAQITLRVPLSLLLMLFTIFAALVTSNSVGIKEVVFAILLFGIFAFLSFFMEKSDLQNGVILLRERANTNTFRKLSTNK